VLLKFLVLGGGIGRPTPIMEYVNNGLTLWEIKTMTTITTLAEQVERMAFHHAKFRGKSASSYMAFALSLSYEAKVARGRVDDSLSYQEKRAAHSKAVADLWAAYAKKYTVGVTSFDKYSATGDYIRLGMDKHGWTEEECLALLAVDAGPSFLQNEKRIGGLEKGKNIKCTVQALRAAKALSPKKEKLTARQAKAEEQAKAKAKTEKAEAKAKAEKIASDNAKIAGGSLEAKISKIADIILENGSVAHLSVDQKLDMSKTLLKLANHVKNEATLQKASIKAEKASA